MTSALYTIDTLLAISGLLLLLIQSARMARQAPAPNPPLMQHLREDSIILAILAYLLGAMILGAVMERAVADPTAPHARMIVGSGSQIVGATVCAIILSRRFGGGFVAFWAGTGRAGKRRKLGLAVGIFIIAVGTCPLLAQGTIRLIQAYSPSTTIETHPTLQALHGGGQPGWTRVGLWMGAALVAPIAEEFFFRGLLQNFLASILTRPMSAIVLSSLAFGAVHLSQAHTVPALVFLGILLGYAYERTGAISVPVVIHALFNLKTLLWDALGAAPPA